MAPSPPGLSILIRTFNSARTLPDVLAMLSIVEGDQLIVVDSGSNDETLDLANSRGADVVRLAPQTFTYGSALNAGFRQARNEWVVVLSSHCVPVEIAYLSTVRRAITEFADSVVAAVGPIVHSDWDWRVRSGITLYRAEDFQKGFGFAAGNPNAFYRRSAWRERPFSERKEGGEDLEWFVNALLGGHTIAGAHGAAVKYQTARSIPDMYRKGRHDYRTARTFIQIGVPTVREIFRHACKQTAGALLGKIPWRVAPRTVAQFIGCYVEAREMARTSVNPVPRITAGLSRDVANR